MTRIKLIHNSKVRRVIMLAMSLMMLLSPIGSNAQMAIVHAEGTTEETTGDTTTQTTAQIIAEKEAAGDYNVITEEPTKIEETYSDGQKVDTTADPEAVSDQTLSYTEKETVANVETHYYLTDEKGEIKTAPKVDENGNEILGADGKPVEVAVEVDAAKVINTEATTDSTPGYAALTPEEEANLVYGYFDAEGNFVEGESPEGQRQAYTKRADGSAPSADDVYILENVNGDKVAVDNNVVSALKGDEVKGYIRETAYYLPGADGNTNMEKAYSEQEIKSQFQEGTYKIDDNGILSLEASHDETNDTYFITVDGNSIAVDPDNIQTKTTYQIKNKEGIVCEVDATTLDQIKKTEYTKVNDMYVMKDDSGNNVYFTEEQMAVATGYNVTYEETTRYYYVTEPQHYTNTYPVSVNGTAYSIAVDFVESDAVKVVDYTKITVTESNGSILIKVPYKMLKGKKPDGTSIWEEKTYEKTVLLSDIQASNQATVSIALTPSVVSKEEVSFSSSYNQTGVKQDGFVQEGTAEKPINEPDTIKINTPSNNYRHLDVLIEGSIYVDDKNNQDKKIAVPVKITNVKAFANVGSENQYEFTFVPGTMLDTNGDYTEYASWKNEEKDGNTKYSIDPNLPICIQATITYPDPVTGKDISFDYMVYVYPTQDEKYNQCGNKTSGGFDYVISADALKEYLNRTVTYNRDNDVAFTDNTTVDSPTPPPTTPPTTPPPTTPPETPPPTTPPETPPTTPPETPPTTPPETPTPTTTPTTPVPTTTPGVLGARRITTTDTDTTASTAAGAAVLGVRRTTDQAVLGKRRAPQTSDSSMSWIWSIGFVVSSFLLAGWTVLRKFKKRIEQK